MRHSSIAGLCGVVLAFLTDPAHTETAPSLDLALYAGVTIHGAISNVYVVQAASEIGGTAAWTSLAFVQLTATNQLFLDRDAPVQGSRMYRVSEQQTPTNMIFIPANTFRMGSPSDEVNRLSNEGPLTMVTLTRGFWIGRYEVMQGEYEEVTGTNPSVFPGDPTRPVSNVSWPDATNYCLLLTQRELAAGRISVGSRYRLPTEAEWECATRAGSTTRFSFGDDPAGTNLTAYAWTYENAGFTVHPVGQKLPNAWGLYDIHGNVWEWCQDWLGDLSGGWVTDPQGPESNAIGWKVTRGGGYDQGDYRSATRYFYGSHPALSDSNLGFRVVLATGP